MKGLNLGSASLRYKNLLVVIKQTAFEEYSQLKLRGQAPKALRWKRLEQRYKAHKQCVNDLLSVLQENNVSFNCVNRVDLDRQHLADIDLMVAVGGDGTVLSAAHFLDHGTIPLLGVNSDPNVSIEDRQVTKKKRDERKSHGALCACTALDLKDSIPPILFGEKDVRCKWTRIRCKVKSTFSETRLVPALNDLLIANPSPGAVSRFRLGWLSKLDSEIDHGLNVWSSGMWISTSTGSTAAMAAAGGQPMELGSSDLQFMIREHMIENSNEVIDHTVDNGFINDDEEMHIRWNSQRGRIYIDGSHLTHNLELGDEIMIDNKAPPLPVFMK
eukprot:jgi/Psemu1/181622/e_gw1.21.140.1